MIAQIPFEQLATPSSALGVIAFLLAKHLFYDSKRNKKDDKQEQEKNELLRETRDGIRTLNNNLLTQISVSNARREANERLGDDRHEHNSKRLDAIEHALPMVCKYRRNG